MTKVGEADDRQGSCGEVAISGMQQQHGNQDLRSQRAHSGHKERRAWCGPKAQDQRDRVWRAADRRLVVKTKEGEGTSLVVQWLKRHVPNAGSPGSIPGQGTRSCMPQIDPWCPNMQPIQTQLLMSDFCLPIRVPWGFPDGSDSKESACNERDPGLIPGSGRSPGKGNGNPLQYSCLENPMNRGAWWTTVHGVAKSRTRLSNWVRTHTHTHIHIHTHIYTCQALRGSKKEPSWNFTSNEEQIKSIHWNNCWLRQSCLGHAALALTQALSPCLISFNPPDSPARWGLLSLF